MAYPPAFGKSLWKITEIQVEVPGQPGIGQLLAIGADENMELYLLTKDPGVGLTGNSGKVYKLVPLKNQ